MGKFGTAWKNTAKASQDEFAQDVLKGLSAHPKRIPSKYLYDDRGSELFAEITELDEYYLTRAEREILEGRCDEIAGCASHAARSLRVIELGPGDGTKVEPLLRACLKRRIPVEYVPVDISEASLRSATERLRLSLDSPLVEVREIVADYFHALDALPANDRGRDFVLFLGSSIGNFGARRSARFLARLRAGLRPGDCALVGFDLKKDPRVLHAAYDDRRGVTGEFNYNLLERMNRELGADFDRSRFRHQAFYSPRQGRMESWLVSVEAQEVRVAALAATFTFQAWEGIHVENSYKYDVDQIRSMAGAAGLAVERNFFDAARRFADSFWRVPLR